MGFCESLILSAFIASPAILQGIVVFGTEWVDATSCADLNNKPPCCTDSSTYNHSSVYSACVAPFGLSELNYQVYLMQVIVFIILFTPIGCGMLDAYCSGEDSEPGACASAGGCCFMLYPIAGILSFIGCMVILSEYSGHSHGTSFNVCLAAGLYVIIVTGILVSLLCIKKRGSDEPEPDPEAGGFVVFVTRVNVYHQLTHWSSSSE